MNSRSTDRNGDESNTEPLKVPIVLVDDHEIVRDGIKSMLLGEEFEVVGEASSGRESLTSVERTSPRIILLEIRMAGGDGFEALTAIKSRFPTVSVLMLTTFIDPTYMARAVAGGASGYLLKGLKRADLISAMRAVALGEILLTREDLTEYLQFARNLGGDFQEPSGPLTPREIEVLQPFATGLNNRDIATILFIAEGSAKTHVEHIVGKLNVSDRVQAAVWAARQGII